MVTGHLSSEEPIRALEVTLKPHSLLDLSAAGLAPARPTPWAPTPDGHPHLSAALVQLCPQDIYSLEVHYLSTIPTLTSEHREKLLPAQNPQFLPFQNPARAMTSPWPRSSSTSHPGQRQWLQGSSCGEGPGRSGKHRSNAHRGNINTEEADVGQ